jgi:hypothetical protein
MENLEDSSTLLTLPTSNATEQQQTTTPVTNGGAQQPVTSLATTPLLGTDQLATQLNNKQPSFVNPYNASNYPMSYNYQQGNYN